MARSIGYLGTPRRYHIYTPEFQVWRVLSSAGSSELCGLYRHFVDVVWVFIFPIFYLARG